MSKRRTWAALPGVALMAMTLLAAGCGTVSSHDEGSPAAGAGSARASGSATGSASRPTPVPTVSSGPAPVAGQPACAGWPTGARKDPLPASFVPVEVLRCVPTTTAIPGKGLYYSATLERATSGISTLVAALRRPPVRQPAGTMCPMLVMLPPQIVLIAKDGSTLSPTFPVAGCGQLQPAVISALNHMPWQTVSVRLLEKAPGSPAKTITPGPGMNGSPAVNTNQ
jgi:hypothetical protein